MKVPFVPVITAWDAGTAPWTHVTLGAGGGTGEGVGDGEGDAGGAAGDAAVGDADAVDGDAAGEDVAPAVRPAWAHDASSSTAISAPIFML
jgi:hypothetical protein